MRATHSSVGVYRNAWYSVGSHRVPFTERDGAAERSSTILSDIHCSPFNCIGFLLLYMSWQTKWYCCSAVFLCSNRSKSKPMSAEILSQFTDTRQQVTYVLGNQQSVRVNCESVSS